MLFSFESFNLVGCLGSEGFVVTRVLSKDVVELHVVDFIRSLGLESLVNKGEFLLSAQKLNIVEDGAETGHGNESTSGAVLVLEEGLDQESAESHLLGKSEQDGVQGLLFFRVEHILGVQDGRSVERLQGLGGVLFQVLLGEDVLNRVVEAHVVHEGWVVRHLVVVFEALVLRDGQHNLLDVEYVTELLAGHVALSKDVVILEEFEQSNSVFLALVHNLHHELVMLSGTVEVSPRLNVGGLGSSGGSIDNVLEAVGIPQEFIVTDFTVRFSILSGDGSDLVFAQLVAKED